MRSRQLPNFSLSGNNRGLTNGVSVGGIITLNLVDTIHVNSSGGFTAPQAVISVVPEPSYTLPGGLGLLDLFQRRRVPESSFR